MNINVTIERLILDGLDLPVDQRPLLQAALEAELAGLLAAHGLAARWQAGGTVPRLSADAIHLSGEGGPTVWGQQIAQAIYGGLSR